MVGRPVRIVEPHLVGKPSMRSGSASGSGTESNASRIGWVVAAVIVSSKSSVPEPGCRP